MADADQMMAAEAQPKFLLSRRRSISRSRSNSSGSGEEEGGLQRCRSVESLCEGELRGNLNYSDEEIDNSPPRMMMGAMMGG
jgi:hypothetical protein